MALLVSFVICQPATAQSILPPASDAIGGGNPLQGLGRSDDPSPSRYQDFAPKNLQNTSPESAESDLGNSGLNVTETLQKLITPNALESLTGGETGSEAAPGSLESKQKSNSFEFTNKAGEAFSDQLPGSTGGDSPVSANDGSSELQSSSENPNSSISTTGGTDAGNEGLPPEPPGLAAPLQDPSDTTSLAEKTETTEPSAKGALEKRTVSGHASTSGASGKHESTSLEHGPRKGSPLSEGVAQRIRHELEIRKLTPQAPKAEPTSKPEPKPPVLVPAPPPVAVNAEGPTPERQALSLIKQGDYHQAEQQLRNLVSTDPTNWHARYLFAVTLVFNKKFDEAKTNYGLIIRKAQDKKLVDMADSGLRKLD